MVRQDVEKTSLAQIILCSSPLMVILGNSIVWLLLSAVAVKITVLFSFSQLSVKTRVQFKGCSVPSFS